MCLFKKKGFNALKRDDVVNAICELEKEEDKIEDQLITINQSIEELKVKAKNEKSLDVKKYYAKKINALIGDKQAILQRGSYLLFNLRLFNKLKVAIEDKDFIVDTGKIKINKLLTDQKALAKFLTKAFHTKVTSENKISETDDIFKEFDNMYEENEKIYGLNEDDDALLAELELDSEDAEINIEQDKELNDNNKTKKSNDADEEIKEPQQIEEDGEK